MIFWPGMGDPYKRKKAIKILVIALVLGAGVAFATSAIQGLLDEVDPIKLCIDDRDIQYRISATLELYIDGNKAEIPANIGISEVGCTHAIHTLSNDGTIFAAWEEEYPFEIGHFFWTWTTFHEKGFPNRDMDHEKSRIIVNGQESSRFYSEPLVNGAHYRAEFTTKAYDESKDKDFLPPDL